MKRFLLLILSGTIAGTISTVPMTVFMLLMGRLLPKWQHYDLPPEKLTDELTERVGVKQHLDKPKRVGLALIAHFWYGALMGAIYPFCAKNLPCPPIFKGIIFGVGVWGGSYLGLLPALQMKTTAFREPLQRNLLLIGAHIIWGGGLGIIEENISHKYTWKRSILPTPS